MPPSGNAKYAVIALLMLIGVVALFLWRRHVNRANAAPAPPPTIARSAEPPSNPKLDDIPLPPPTEDTAEEKPETKTSGRGAYNPAQGCEGKCKGVAPPELEQAIQVRAAKARRCYNQALSQDSSLKGHVIINVRIGPAGNICAASVASNDMGTPSVANCAANMFLASGGYPAPRGGCVEARVPLSFVAQGQ
ncbi:MAG: AgmX/PglI C-terminal domain-containing protein [Polyangiaceae bacterium]